jgi:hypothetical protein
MRTSFLSVLALPLLGCGASGASTTSSDDHLEESPATTPSATKVVSCGLTLGSGDPTFRVDTLTCTQTSAADLPTGLHVAIELLDAKGNQLNGFATPTAPVNLPFEFDGAYPLTVKVHVVIDANFLQDQSFTQTVTFAQPTTNPIPLDVPFAFWPVTIHSNVEGSFSTTSQTIPLAPWATDSGATSTTTLAPGGILDPAKDFTATFVVPTTGVTSIPGAVQLDPPGFLDPDPPPVPLTIDGPGSFVVDATGNLTRAPVR